MVIIGDQRHQLLCCKNTESTITDPQRTGHNIEASARLVITSDQSRHTKYMHIYSFITYFDKANENRKKVLV